jgi:regulator of protease activity HflC (stomatin/prohibitin superfamily)
MKYSAIIAIVAATFLGITALFGSWYTVDQGERAVILRNGEIVGVGEPGLGFKMPIMDSAVKLSIQSRKVEYAGMATYSRDQQPATMKVSVNYRLNAGEVSSIYADYGSEQGLVDRLINPRVQAETKNVFGQFNAVAAIQERERLNLEVLLAIQESVQGPVTVESVQIEEIDFSAAYEQSIEQRMLAEVEVQKIRQNLERERVQAEIVVTQANAEATRIREIGQAEADAINARGQALNDNPNLVQLVQAERWNGILPTTMIPNGALPVIGIQ